jgi:sugar phosphate isomerase/epimerase
MTAAIAVQLYTLRDSIGEDPTPMFERLAEAGFVGVESAGFYGQTPSQYANALAGAGLALASAHVGFDARPDDWLDHWARDLDAHREAGAETVVVPMLFPNQFADLDAVRRSADLLNAALAPAADRELRLGYHNHFWEFGEIDGRPALAHFFDHCDPAVFAEIDIYWATVGGVDTAGFVASLGDRVRLLHVKDGPADSHESAMVAVGSGNIAIVDIIGAAPNAEWHIVELDRCDSDMFEAVAASQRFLVGAGLSAGASR